MVWRECLSRWAIACRINREIFSAVVVGEGGEKREKGVSRPAPCLCGACQSTLDAPFRRDSACEIGDGWRWREGGGEVGAHRDNATVSCLHSLGDCR